MAKLDPEDEDDFVREGTLGVDMAAAGASDRAGIVMLKEDIPIKGSDMSRLNVGAMIRQESEGKRRRRRRGQPHTDDRAGQVEEFVFV